VSRQGGLEVHRRMVVERGVVLEELGPIHGRRPVDLLTGKMLYNILHKHKADLLKLSKLINCMHYVYIDNISSPHVQ